MEQVDIHAWSETDKGMLIGEGNALFKNKVDRYAPLLLFSIPDWYRPWEERNLEPLLKTYFYLLEAKSFQ